VRTRYANLTTALINCHTKYYTLICSVCQAGQGFQAILGIFRLSKLLCVCTRVRVRVYACACRCGCMWEKGRG